MKCSQCLTENAEMIRTKGYGRSYIPNIMDCKEHNSLLKAQAQTISLSQTVQPQTKYALLNGVPVRIFESGSLRYTN